MEREAEHTDGPTVDPEIVQHVQAVADTLDQLRLETKDPIQWHTECAHQRRRDPSPFKNGIRARDVPWGEGSLNIHPLVKVYAKEDPMLHSVNVVVPNPWNAARDPYRWYGDVLLQNIPAYLRRVQAHQWYHGISEPKPQEVTQHIQNHHGFTYVQETVLTHWAPKSLPYAHFTKDSLLLQITELYEHFRKRPYPSDTPLSLRDTTQRGDCGFRICIGPIHKGSIEFSEEPHTQVVHYHEVAHVVGEAIRNIEREMARDAKQE